MISDTTMILMSVRKSLYHPRCVFHLGYEHFALGSEKVERSTMEVCTCDGASFPLSNHLHVCYFQMDAMSQRPWWAMMYPP